MSKREEIKIKLDGLPKTNVFKVPEGYFINLPLVVGSKLITGNSNSGKAIYKVPEGYFDKLPGKINSRLSRSKELPIPQTIHSVPEGYFDGLSDKIQKRIAQKEKKLQVDTPVIQLIPVVRYSIAAGFAIAIIVTAMVLYKNFSFNETSIVKKESSKDTFVATALIAKLSKTEIKTYLEDQGNVDVNQLMHYSSSKKKEKIQKAFEKTILDVKLKEEEKKALELELNDIDMTELYPEL